MCGMVHLLIAIDRLILLACQLSSPTRRALALNSWDLTSLEIGTGGLCKENGRDEPNRKGVDTNPPTRVSRSPHLPCVRLGKEQRPLFLPSLPCQLSLNRHMANQYS